jgi:hypothetical protein
MCVAVGKREKEKKEREKRLRLLDGGMDRMEGMDPISNGFPFSSHLLSLEERQVVVSDKITHHGAGGHVLAHKIL